MSLPEHYQEIQKNQEDANMQPVFYKQAVFSDETRHYQTPFMPNPGDQVTIRIRTLKDNVDAVYFICGSIRALMEVEESINGFDYYAITITLGDEPLHYYFELQAKQTKYFYNHLGVTRDLQEYYSFGITPGFTTPEWAQGAVMYQIFVERFYNGDPSNDVETGEYAYIGDHSQKVDQWDKPPAAIGVREFYGGDLQGIIDKLDYLQDLGVEVLYLNPIFVSPSNHKYDIQDYDYVDPHYGKIVKKQGQLLQPGDMDNSHATSYITKVTDKANLEASNELFIQLVEELHRRGMKIILDGVFNHCGSFNKWLDRERIYENQEGYEKGAYVDKDSPYHSFFKFNNEHDWPYNEFYDGWWGHDTLPKLCYEHSKKLVKYILEIGKKWVSPPYNADGWRLDVAADLGFSQEYNHKFWQMFRKAVKKANPNAIILAEHYGEPSPWLQGDQWDTVMNYDAFMEPVSWFLTGMEKHSDEYRPELDGNGQAMVESLRRNQSSYLAPSLQCSMNELSNHDHSRFLTRTNGVVGRVSNHRAEVAESNVKPQIMRLGVMMQMTMPGAPTIYYGDEAGLCGFTDPDNRRTYPWGREDQQMIQFHKDMIRLHKTYDIVKHGSMKFLCAGKNYAAYGRFSKTEQLIVAINKGDYPLKVEIPVWQTGISKTEPVEIQRILKSSTDSYTTEKESYTVVKGTLTANLASAGGMVFYHKMETES